MKRITSIALCVLASLATVGSASAQDHVAKSNVPFGFYVGDKWVPAGTYILTSDSRSPDIIAIHNADSTVSLLRVGHLSEQQSRSNVLAFKKYGEQYFLHEIDCSDCRMNVAFSDSKREKSVRTREASAASPTNVYLALR